VTDHKTTPWHLVAKLRSLVGRDIPWKQDRTDTESKFHLLPRTTRTKQKVPISEQTKVQPQRKCTPHRNVAEWQHIFEPQLHIQVTVNILSGIYDNERHGTYLAPKSQGIEGYALV
jgi:hypothetical protein